MIDTTKYAGHTAGPWTNWHNQVIVGEDEEATVICEMGYYIDKSHEANALLIADAPELLAEVERLQKMVESLKQCANCKYGKKGTMVFCCTSDKEEEAITLPQFKCDKWEMQE